MDVNVALYDFLNENETGLFLKGKQVIAYVHVHFFDLDTFTEIIGSHWFDEGGMEIHLFKNTVAIELNDIFESYEHSILAYKNCFDNDDIKRYEDELKALV